MPGGKCEEGEDAEIAAIREAREECGKDRTFDGMRAIDRSKSPRSGWDHTTFAVPCADEFEPKRTASTVPINGHSVMILRNPYTPACKATLDKVLGRTEGEDDWSPEARAAARELGERGDQPRHWCREQRDQE